MTETSSEAPKPGRRLGSLNLVWRYASHYPAQVAIAVAALLVTTGVTLYIPWAVRSLIDQGVAAGGNRAHIGQVFYTLLVAVLILAITTALRFYFVSWLGERTIADVRVAVQTNLLRLSPSWFEENAPAEVASRLTADTTQIETAVGTTVSVALRNVLMGIGGVASLFWVAPMQTLVLLVSIPIVILPIVIMGRRVREYSRSSQDRIADIGSMLVETLSAMKVVQSFGQERREADRFSGAVDRGFTAAKRRILIRAIMTALVIGLLFGSL
jgi:ATP-binding cassette subfamily B protein